MARRGGEEGSNPPPGTIQPGTLTALLQKIAQAPEVEQGGAWDQALRPGAVVGRFELLRELGRGGFGVVWEARDRDLGRSVAFKAVRAGGKTSLREERLLKEAEAAARLQHPNIVTLFEVGHAEQGPYLVLELLRGQTLAERLSGGTLPVEEALRVGVEVAKGVSHAHGQGVIHRDLKPENVFLCEDGQVKVLDFGLAHAFGQRRAEGGTSGYMAPEQAEGAPEDERADVFALGVILFEMLAGRLPFPSGEAVGKAPALEVPGAPGLGPLVARLLEAKPILRPRDGKAVLDALFEVARRIDGANPVGPVRSRRQGWLRLALLVAAGVALGAVVAVGAARWRASRNPPPAAPAGRIAVVVADFTNETRDPDLDALSGLLVTALQQSRRLDVLTRGRMVDLLHSTRRERVGRIDEPLAREVARRAGASVLLLPSVRRFEDVLALELRCVDPGKDADLFAIQERAVGKSKVPSLVDRLAERTRLSLGETAADVHRSSVEVEKDVTASLEAYRHYALGIRCLDESEALSTCTSHFERAVAFDSGFALAHLRLAFARFWGTVPGAREAMAEALRHVERAPPRERLEIWSFAAQLDGREGEAAALFRQAAEAAPDDRLLQGTAADFFATRNELSLAVPFGRRAADLDPSGRTTARAYLATWLGALGRTDDLQRLAGEIERLPASPARSMAHAAAHAWLGEKEPALDALQDVESSMGELPGAPLLLAAVSARFGAFGVEKRLRARASTDWTVHYALAALQRGQGRRREALASLAAIPEENTLRHAFLAELLAGDGNPGEVGREARLASLAEPVLSANLAVFLAYAGDPAAAAGLAGGLSPDSPRERVYRAVARWRRGERAEALAALRTLASENPWSADYPVPAPSFLLGEVAHEAREDATAVEALSRFHSLVIHNPYWGWAYPRSLLLLARSQERLGRRDEARASVEKLLALWRRADPDLPLLAEAKALRARLAGSRGAGKTKRPAD